MTGVGRLLGVAALLGALAACVRPTANYDVTVYADGTELGDVLPDPEPMGGMIEVSRFRLWGTNLGYGLAGLFSDLPRADGASFVFGTASFGYPRDAAFDRYSTILTPGPPATPREDACVTRIVSSRFLEISEYVDVGDRIEISSGDTRILLPRDPASYPDPAGETWFVGYGDRLVAEVPASDVAAGTWKSGAVLELSFPGAVQPRTATFGAIPYPVADVMSFPEDVLDLRVGDVAVRAPHHELDGHGLYDPGFEDDVRFDGPWERPMSITWTPSATGQSLTVTVRLLGLGDEIPCEDCEDCGPGFTCDPYGWCVGDDGAGWAPLGEVTCTVADDGEFEFRPSLLADLTPYVRPRAAGGAVLMVSRIAEGTVDVPDALTANGRRVPMTPVRTRASDIVVTRLELP